MGSDEHGPYEIDAHRCIRCGAAPSIAPDLIRLGSRSAVLRAQPATEDERRQVAMAQAMCPVGAIRRSEAS